MRLDTSESPRYSSNMDISRSTPGTTAGPVRAASSVRAKDAYTAAASPKPDDESAQIVRDLSANLRESLQAANERLADRGTSISMAVDRATNMVIVQVKDRDTGDTVRQIPPEAAMQVARNIDRLTGILVDKKA